MTLCVGGMQISNVLLYAARVIERHPLQALLKDARCLPAMSR